MKIIHQKQLAGNHLAMLKAKQCPHNNFEKGFGDRGEGTPLNSKTVHSGLSAEKLFFAHHSP